MNFRLFFSYNIICHYSDKRSILKDRATIEGMVLKSIPAANFPFNGDDREIRT